MEKGKVSKMGVVLLVNVTSTKFRYKDVLILKPKGLDIRLYLKVSRYGNRRVVVIPKSYHQFFKHKSLVYISKKRRMGAR